MVTATESPTLVQASCNCASQSDIALHQQLQHRLRNSAQKISITSPRTSCSTQNLPSVRERDKGPSASSGSGREISVDPPKSRTSSCEAQLQIGARRDRLAFPSARGARNRWFVDSSLEEAVTSEPVSESPRNSLLAGKIQGI